MQEEDIEIGKVFYKYKNEIGQKYKVVRELEPKGKTEIRQFVVKFKDSGNLQEVSITSILNGKLKDIEKQKKQTVKNNRNKKKEYQEERREDTFKNEIQLGKNPKMIILDIASRSTGFAVFEGDKLLDFGNFSISDKKESRVIYRLKFISEEVFKLIERIKPDIVVVENVLQKTKRALYVLSMGHGIILYHLIKNNIPFRRVDVNAWKNYCGIPKLKSQVQGRTDREKSKNATVKFVDEKYGLDIRNMEYTKEEKTLKAWEDRSDAIAIGWYAINNLIY